MGNISNTHITFELRIYYFKEAIIMAFDKIIELLKSDDYKSRAIGEYYFVKDKYNKLHSMIIKREAGKLDFKPKCPMEQWKSQASAMGQYLYQLEIKAEIEGYSLDLD